MQITCVSLNMWNGGRLFDEIIAFLQQEQPDILLLQEVYNGTDPHLDRRYRTIETLQQSCSFPFWDFAPAFIDNRAEGKIPQGNAVFCTFPIVTRAVQFFNEPFQDDYVSSPEHYASCPRNLQHVVLDTPAGELNVCNMHGVWDLDGDNFSERRQRMSTTILEVIAGKHKVILAGDTNAKPTNPAVRAVEAYLPSVFGDTRSTSFNMRRKDNPGYATAVVDLMYVSPDIAVVDKQCPDVDISDHLPLIAVLDI